MLEQLEAILNEAADSETFAASYAKLMYKIYGELRNAGFSPEEAIAIVTSFKLS